MTDRDEKRVVHRSTLFTLHVRGAAGSREALHGPGVGGGERDGWDRVALASRLTPACGAY